MCVFPVFFHMNLSLLIYHGRGLLGLLYFLLEFMNFLASK